MRDHRSKTWKWQQLTREFTLLLEAVAVLSAATVVIRIMPFRSILRLAGMRSRGQSPSPAERERTNRRVQWAVIATARRLPWRPLCFPQGLAAQWMLRRRGIPSTFYYGVMIAEAAMDAHVWVRDGDWTVVGGRPPDGMKVLVQAPASTDPAIDERALARPIRP